MTVVYTPSYLTTDTYSVNARQTARRAYEGSRGRDPFRPMAHPASAVFKRDACHPISQHGRADRETLRKTRRKFWAVLSEKVEAGYPFLVALAAAHQTSVSRDDWQGQNSNRCAGFALLFQHDGGPAPRAGGVKRQPHSPVTICEIRDALQLELEADGVATKALQPATVAMRQAGCQTRRSPHRVRLGPARSDRVQTVPTSNDERQEHCEGFLRPPLRPRRTTSCLLFRSSANPPQQTGRHVCACRSAGSAAVPSGDGER
ncbi:hypothetical protein OPT61_g7042 [Boeremia exigua]|uniref:Uncharacterized protein n=1 Tax=Boeremia exigua TaxID=749465 RepID=A0ACC2I4D1_9PLEO|nr:hypothetical protein OPT61_g7042 [Boeremia exigua]